MEGDSFTWWQLLHQFQRPGEIRDRLTVGKAPDGVRGRSPQIRHRPAVVPPPFKMHSEFCGDLAHACAVRGLLTLAEPLMEPEALRRCYPLLQNVLVERMNELITPRHRSVRPVVNPQRPQELPAPRQALTPRFNPRYLFLRGSRHRRDREFHPYDARCL